MVLYKQYANVINVVKDGINKIEGVLKGKSGMKKIIKLFMVIFVCMGLSGCAGNGGDKAYPITMEGTEVIVGETTVGTLIDAGFTIREISYSDDNEITGDTMLEKNSYYTGYYVDKDDTEYCSIAIVTDNKDIPIAEAIIAKVQIDSELSHFIDNTTFDGVKLPDLTIDAAQEHIAGSEKSDDNSSVYLSGANYFVDVNFNNDSFTELEIKRKYDVDYSN